jgi:hypothetical protein
VTQQRHESAKPRVALLPFVQLDSPRRLDRAAADGWFREEGAVSGLDNCSLSGASADRHAEAGYAAREL